MRRGAAQVPMTETLYESRNLAQSAKLADLLDKLLSGALGELS
jgi:hypothetical protein